MGLKEARDEYIGALKLALLLAEDEADCFCDEPKNDIDRAYKNYNDEVLIDIRGGRDGARDEN